MRWLAAASEYILGHTDDVFSIVQRCCRASGIKYQLQWRETCR